MLPDVQLGQLITYLKYHGTSLFSYRRVFNTYKKKVEDISESMPALPLLERGFVAFDSLPLADVQATVSAAQNEESLVVVQDYLQVTEAGKEYVQKLGDEDPARLARVCIQLFYLDQAASYIEALPLGELSEFIVSDLSVIREVACERYDKLNKISPTPPQVQFLIARYVGGLALWDLELLRPDKRELIEWGFVNVVELGQSVRIVISKLGKEYLERHHVVALVKRLRELRSPSAWELLDRLTVAQLPELLASRESIVRHWAEVKMEIES